MLRFWLSVNYSSLVYCPAQTHFPVQTEPLNYVELWTLLLPTGPKDFGLQEYGCIWTIDFWRTGHHPQFFRKEGYVWSHTAIGVAMLPPSIGDAMLLTLFIGSTSCISFFLMALPWENCLQEKHLQPSFFAGEDRPTFLAETFTKGAPWPRQVNLEHWQTKTIVPESDATSLSLGRLLPAELREPRVL